MLERYVGKYLKKGGKISVRSSMSDLARAANLLNWNLVWFGAALVTTY